ncbi:MAG: ribosomal protein S18-alanine N-acetyltransferase [Anaeroplasma sp.]
MIRKALVNDIDLIVELEKSTLGSTLGKDMLMSYIDNPFFYVYVYEREEEIIGYISFTFDGEVIEIYNFCVDSLFQEKGIGTQLLSNILNNYYALGAKSSILEVRSSNTKAIILYEKFGYRLINKRRNYYSNGEDALIMQKKFISYLELEDKYLSMFAEKKEYDGYTKYYDTIQPDKYYHNFYEVKNNDNILLDKLINNDEGIICFKANYLIKDKFKNIENNIYMHSCIRGIKIFSRTNGIIKEVDDNNYIEVQRFIYLDDLRFGEEYAQLNSKRLVELRNYQNMKAFVIYSDDKVIGYIHTFIYKDFAKMEDFFILDEYQKKGYGSTLFKYALDYLKNQGINDICLVADNEDTPKHMYEKMGFIKTGEYYFYRK